MVDLHITLGNILVMATTGAAGFVGELLRRAMRDAVDKLERLDSYFEKTDIAYNVVLKKFPAEVGEASGEILRAKGAGA